MTRGRGGRSRKSRRALAAGLLAAIACAGVSCTGMGNTVSDPGQTALAARGSAGQPVPCSTLTQLRNMSLTGNYKLTKNITMSSTDAGFVPIGSPYNPFRGTFNGNGFTIYNFRTAGNANTTSPGWYRGLFSATDGAILTKIRMVNVNVVGAGYTGAIVGSMNNTQLTDSYVTGTVSGTTSTDAPGNALGLVVGGMGPQSAVYRCTATGTVQGVALTIGGFAGDVSGNGTIVLNQPDPRDTLEEIFTNVNVKPTMPASSYNGINVAAGGLAGQVQGAVIHEINVAGPVYGRGAVGGILGSIINNASGVEACEFHMAVFLGTITSASTPDPAGAIGTMAGDLEGRCAVYYNKDVDGGKPLPTSDIACNEGFTAAVLKKPHYFPDKYFDPYIVGQLVTQDLINQGIFPQCKLASGSETDWGFGTCGDPRIWFTNADNQFNTLARIPEPGVQPL